MLASFLKMVDVQTRRNVGVLWAKVANSRNPDDDYIALERSSILREYTWAKLLQQAYLSAVSKAYDEVRYSLPETERRYGKREYLRTISTPLDTLALANVMDDVRRNLSDIVREVKGKALKERMIQAFVPLKAHVKGEVSRLYDEGYRGTLERLGSDMRWQRVTSIPDDTIVTHGGPGSGNFGHAGRPGKVGGSASSGSASGHGYSGAEIQAMSPAQRKILSARMGVSTRDKTDDELKDLLSPVEKKHTAKADKSQAIADLLSAKVKGEEEGGEDPRGDLKHLPDSGKVSSAKSSILSKVNVSDTGVPLDKLHVDTDLTPEQFRAVLLDAHMKGEVRLSGWPRMPDDLPSPELAPVVSDKIMWYANKGVTTNYDPSQPRDDEGKWTETGKGGSSRKPGGRVQRGNTLDQVAQYLLGKGLEGRSAGATGRQLTDDDIRAIGFSPEGTTVLASGSRGGELSFYTESESRNAQGLPDLTASRTIRKPWFAPLTCYNGGVIVDGKYKGRGLELFDAQVKTLQALGVKRIVASAAGDAETARTNPRNGTGYYVWPRFGYSGIMSAKQIAALPEDIRKALKGKRDIRDLFDLPGGAEAWKTHGSTIKVHFDLSPGSRNMRALEAYKRERASRTVVNYDPNQPRDDEGKWTDSGNVDIYDVVTGEVFWTGTKEEAEKLLKAQSEEVGPDHGLAIREENKAAKEEQKRKNEESIRRHEEEVAERRRREALKTGYGLLPGHVDYVEPPPRLYHATFNADEIMTEGLKTSDDLGKQVLGGVASHLVSFTTKENAEAYRDALAVARKAAKGEMSDDELIEVGAKYGVTRGRMRQIIERVQGPRERKSFEVMQAVSIEGRKFPMFMGGRWPENLQTAKPPAIVSIDSKDVQEIYYNPGETEWRLGKLKGVRVKRE